MLFTKKSITISMAILALLIIYFLTIASVGNADNVYLSFLNAPIMAIGLFLIIRERSKSDGKNFRYMNGFLSGLANGFLISVLFTVFMMIYLLEINPSLVEDMNATLPIATGTASFGVLLFIFLSGVSTTIVSSLLIIPIFKRTWNTKQVRDKQKPLNQYS